MLSHSRRDLLLGCLAHPSQIARVLGWRFALWSMWPGDVFEDFVCDQVLVVREVRRDYVVAVPVAGQVLDAFVTGRCSGVVVRPASVQSIEDGGPFSVRHFTDGRTIVTPCRYSRRARDRWTRARAGRAEVARALVG